MGKQVLEKRLNDKPQSEQQMWTLSPTLTAIYIISRILREGDRRIEPP